MSTPPVDLRDLATRFITTELVTIDAAGQPIVWPVTPYPHPGGGDCIDVTTGIGYPKKARDAESDPRTALLFSDPTGSGIAGAPMVLVQGTAHVDDADLDANAERYLREAAEKLPAATKQMPPRFMHGWLRWYLARLYIHVEPEVVWTWPGGDATTTPERIARGGPPAGAAAAQQPAVPGAPTGARAWDERVGELGTRYPTAVVACTAQDGRPFAVRLPVRADAAERVLHLDAPAGLPLAPGRAALCAHDHDEAFTWQRNFQVRGELRHEGGGWALVPDKLVGGFELPPGSLVARMRLNAKKVRRFRRIAKRELASRGG